MSYVITNNSNNNIYTYPKLQPTTSTTIVEETIEYDAEGRVVKKTVKTITEPKRTDYNYPGWYPNRIYCGSDYGSAEIYN